MCREAAPTKLCSRPWLPEQYRGYGKAGFSVRGIPRSGSMLELSSAPRKMDDSSAVGDVFTTKIHHPSLNRGGRMC